MSKKYKCGLYVGRFQPLHLGHYNVIDSMLRTCETVVIAVGSAQECGTLRNPFSYALRATMINKSFSFAFPRVMVIPIPDREHPSNDPSWGEYVFKTVKTYTGLTPDVVYEGEEFERNNWYNNYNIPIVRIKRTELPISATEIREALMEENDDLLLAKTPCAVWMTRDILRKELLKCYNLQET